MGNGENMIAPNLSCTVGDDFGFDVIVPNNADGSMPDLTGADITWGLYRDAYTNIPYLKKTDGTVVTKTINGVQYRVVQIDLTSAETASCPPGDLYHETKVAAVKTKHTSNGIFRLLPSPNP